MAGRVVRAVVAAGFVVAGLAPGAEAAPPAIAGRTVVTVNGAAKMTIRIPYRARLVIDVTKSVRIDGGGRFAGLVLREHHAQGEEAAFLRLPERLGSRVYVSAPTIPGGRCEQVEPVPYSDCTKVKPATHYDLRRGTYTMTAFSDGVPATFTLRFENYTGAVALRPARPVPYGSSDVVTSVGAPVAWSAGTALRPTTTADLYTFGWWRQDESNVAQRAACWYDGTDGIEQAGAYRWLPGCPAASTISGGEVATPLFPAWGPARGGDQWSMATAYSVSPGRYGVGMWVSARNVRDTGGFGFWLGR